MKTGLSTKPVSLQPQCSAEVTIIDDRDIRVACRESASPLRDHSGCYKRLVKKYAIIAQAPVALPLRFGMRVDRWMKVGIRYDRPLGRYIHLEDCSKHRSVKTCV